MKIDIRDSFDRDVDKIQDRKLLEQIERAVREVELTSNSFEIPGLKKLKGFKNYYRIRIRNYRIGVFILKDEISFIRFLHRKDIYRNFPPQ